MLSGRQSHRGEFTRHFFVTGWRFSTYLTLIYICNMAAFIIVDIEITHPEEYESYKKLTPASLSLYEGRFAVRGGESHVLEGDWTPGRLVVLEFPSMEKALAWWNSPEYAPAKALRHRTAITRMVAVQGT